MIARAYGTADAIILETLVDTSEKAVVIADLIVDISLVEAARMIVFISVIPLS
jgi:hypothetical protein